MMRRPLSSLACLLALSFSPVSGAMRALPADDIPDDVVLLASPVMSGKGQQACPALRFWQDPSRLELGTMQLEARDEACMAPVQAGGLPLPTPIRDGGARGYPVFGAQMVGGRMYMRVQADQDAWLEVEPSVGEVVPVESTHNVVRLTALSQVCTQVPDGTAGDCRSVGDGGMKALSAYYAAAERLNALYAQRLHAMSSAEFSSENELPVPLEVHVFESRSSGERIARGRDGRYVRIHLLSVEELLGQWYGPRADELRARLRKQAAVRKAEQAVSSLRGRVAGLLGSTVLEVRTRDAQGRHVTFFADGC